MSRIGKKEIVIPEKTEVQIQNGKIIVKGPHGELERIIPDGFEIKLSENKLTIKPKREEMVSLWGTYASHLVNMIKGVNTTYEKKLIIEGIGYKVENKSDKLQFALGFSHPIIIDIPQGIKVAVEKNNISISGVNKETVGSFAAELRDLKKPEPYKGKGIRYFNEVIKIKQGKKTV
ncbi:MAG TPA: 50S ribosomal protein L6 [Candidatus Paceibacterota bacterium]